MPVFETESRIGRIVSINGALDMLYVLYPSLKLSVRHEDVMRLNYKTGNMLVFKIKNPIREYGWYGKDNEHPSLNIRGKVTGFSVAKAPAYYNPTAYVNVHCTLEYLSESEITATTIMLRLEHWQHLNFKQYDTFLISLSDR